MIAAQRARWVFLLLVGGALAQPALADNPAEEAPAKKGVVFVVGGVGGSDPMRICAPLFLPCAGVTHEFRDFYWSHGLGRVLKDLQDTRYRAQKAEELAGLILAEKQQHPDRPIYLLANSGGTGLALLTAEHLPAQTLERIILLAAAVSPTYDLRPALRATRREIVNNYSTLDRIILHWGTSQFGTTDRYYVASAGCLGFTVPADLSTEDRALYARLVQIPWEPRLLLEFHTGGHSGWHSPGFLMNEVAPWLRD
jgi:hypothetical protein